jgi:hypothetical protein
MMFTDITVKEIFLPFLVIIGSAFALLVFFRCGGTESLLVQVRCMLTLV